MAILLSIILGISILIALFYAGKPVEQNESQPGGANERGYFVALTPFHNHWKDVSLLWDEKKRSTVLWLPRTAVPVDQRWRRDTRDGAHASTWVGPEGFFPSFISFNWGCDSYIIRVWKPEGKWELEVEKIVKKSPKKVDDADDFF